MRRSIDYLIAGAVTAALAVAIASFAGKVISSSLENVAAALEQRGGRQ